VGAGQGAASLSTEIRKWGFDRRARSTQRGTRQGLEVPSGGLKKQVQVDVSALGH